MKRLKFGVIVLFILIIAGTAKVNGQNDSSSKVQFLNAPVLFKEKGKSIQQVVAAFHSDKGGEIAFTSGGKELLTTNFRRGDNRFLLNFEKVDGEKEVEIDVKIDDNVVEKYTVTLKPPKKWQIYFVQHSHTDIGYTRPQSEILAEQLRYIDYALDYCDQTDTFPDDAKFRWTCESAWVTQQYLLTRPQAQIERLKKRIREGRIEVTAMYFNMAEIADENIMYDYLQSLREFKKQNIPVKLAMQNDVNGIAWCIPDYLKNTSVKYLIMGINETRSILPFDKPTAFWWEAPSGARLLAFRADHYMTGNFYGIESEAIRPANMLWHLADLDNRGYPFDRIGIQFSGYRTDNAPPSTAACKLVEEWNAKYEMPKLRLATGSEFLDYVDKNYANELPVYKKAWLDWWTDGYGSTSRETAEVRKTQNLEQVDEGVFAMVNMLGGKLEDNLQQKIEHISENALFFDEHTCGAAESISDPFSINSERQWLQKGAYAWEALKQVTLLNEDALGKLQAFFKRAPYPVIYVVNSMGWERSETVELFIDYEILPLGKEFTITDLTTGKKVPVQFSHGRREGAYWNLEVSKVPALGFKALKIEVTDKPKEENLQANENTQVLENRFFKIEVDEKTGGIKSFFDKELDTDLYDPQNPYYVGQPVRETLPDRGKMTPSHSTVFNVKVSKGVQGNVWNSINVAADLEGFTKGEQGEPKGIQWEIRLYNNTKKVEFAYQARKEILTDPEALYVAFPFRLPNSRIVFETIGGSLTQGDQLPGSSSDWNAAQNFVSVRSDAGQIIMVSNEVPLWQFSDFNMGKFERYPKAGKPWLYSWVMNNYWFTNFRAFQEGAFNWTYQITTTKDTTNTAATKYGWGVRNPILTRTFPGGKDELSSYSVSTLGVSGDSNVVLINTRPAFKKNTLLLHFREVDGKTAGIQLSSRLENQPLKSLKEVNILGEEIRPLEKYISFKPKEVKFIEVQY